MAHLTLIACPIDGRDDTIQRVSAVYRNGAPQIGLGGIEGSLGQNPSIGVKINRRKGTVLSELLAPPGKAPHFSFLVKYYRFPIGAADNYYDSGD